MSNRELRERDEIDELLDDFGRQYKKLAPEERAYIFIKTYFDGQDSVDIDSEAGSRMHDRFMRWLISPMNRKAKDMALERVFNEYCGEMIDKAAYAFAKTTA